MATRNRLSAKQLEGGLSPGLLTDENKRRATYLVTAADQETKRAWSQQAERLTRSLTPTTLEKSSERELQGAFLDALFVRLLGYESGLAGHDEFTIRHEVSTEVDATKPDGALGWFYENRLDRVVAVIELKNARTGLDQRQLSRPDRLTPVDQAFLYATKFTGCKWVIVCNFRELRLYSHSYGQRLYESFDLQTLGDPERLVEFVSLLRPSALLGETSTGHGYLEGMLGDQPSVRDRDITQIFYDEYTAQRDRLLRHFLDQDSGAPARDVVKAAQKLIDRVLFICFAEDTGSLLPTKILKTTAEISQRSRSRSPHKIWDELRELFRDIDQGRPDVSPAIPAYNGGLFAEDELLDKVLTVNDGLALELVGFGRYDYRNTITVEVLGHVFEQSISDLESLRRVLSLDPDAVESDPIQVMEARRAKGVFYTPRWVTSYIVEATVGPAAADRDFVPEALGRISILDPACGSGAFLAQAYRHLLELAESTVLESLPLEQRLLSEMTPIVNRARYLDGLRGIDLMPEAVEIARLSLWLSSATKSQRLHNLDGIKEGNTLSPEGGDVLDSYFKDGLTKDGFDICVGNPPWGATIDYEIDPSLDLARGQFDTYELFIERALRDAVKDGGYFGFVIPDRILRPEGERTRRWLFDHYQVREVIKLGEGVFPGVFRASVIIVVRKLSPSANDSIRTLTVMKADRDRLEQIGSTHLRSLMTDRGGFISRSRITEDEAYEIPLGATDDDIAIMETMREGSLAWTGPNGVFEPYGRGVETGTEGFVVRCNACFEWQIGPRKRSQSRGGGYKTKECDHCGVTLDVDTVQDSAQIIRAGRPDTEAEGLPGDGWRPIYVGEDVSRYRLDPPMWIRTGVPNINYKSDELYAPPKLLIGSSLD